MAKVSFEEKLEKSKELIDRLMNPEITLEECIKKIKKPLKRIDYTCYQVIQELKNLYLTDKGAILVLLIGNEELLGLRLALS